MQIHQILAGYADGDAISNQAIQLREIFRRWGYHSEIYVDPSRVSPSLKQDCRSLADYSAQAGDFALHHYGIASPAVEVFLAAGGRKILVYHNITPEEYFAGFDDAVAAQLRLARAELPIVARQVQAVWTVSQFNARELLSLGLGNVKVFPLKFSPANPPLTPEPQILRKLRGPLKNILFVGRIAPNKRVEDLIPAFAWYHRGINPYSRLLIVGSPQSAPRYFAMLRMLAGDLVLPNVCFEGFASPAGLLAYYQVADLYVSTSAHEGYGLPLVEAMAHGIPVIARAVGGTPEAMDGAGVLYDELTPAELAALFDLVLTDSTLRAEVAASQARRVQRDLERNLEAEVKTLLTGLLV